MQRDESSSSYLYLYLFIQLNSCDILFYGNHGLNWFAFIHEITLTHFRLLVDDQYEFRPSDQPKKKFHLTERAMNRCPQICLFWKVFLYLVLIPYCFFSCISIIICGIPQLRYHTQAIMFTFLQYKNTDMTFAFFDRTMKVSAKEKSRTRTASHIVQKKNLRIGSVKWEI